MSQSYVKRSTLFLFARLPWETTQSVSCLLIQCSCFSNNSIPLTIHSWAQRCPIFCFSVVASEMNAGAVRVQFFNVFCSGPRASLHTFATRTSAKFRLVGSMCLVGARRSSETTSGSSNFFSSVSKSWRVCHFHSQILARCGQPHQALAHPGHFGARTQILRKH